MLCTKSSAYTRKAWPSRKESRPAMQSISPPEITTARTGQLRGVAVGSGCNCGAARNWAGKSGLAFSSTQFLPSALTAREAWERGRTAGSPAPARTQQAQRQFHCGKPPPAAAPSTLTNIVRPAKALGLGSVFYFLAAEI